MSVLNCVFAKNAALDQKYNKIMKAEFSILSFIYSFSYLLMLSRFKSFKYVLEFMYHGEVNVSQDDLNAFLAVAEELQVKGTVCPLSHY